jgi:hypothetical protein
MPINPVMFAAHTPELVFWFEIKAWVTTSRHKEPTDPLHHSIARCPDRARTNFQGQLALTPHQIFMRACLAFKHSLMRDAARTQEPNYKLQQKANLGHPIRGTSHDARMISLPPSPPPTKRPYPPLHCVYCSQSQLPSTFSFLSLLFQNLNSSQEDGLNPEAGVLRRGRRFVWPRWGRSWGTYPQQQGIGSC